MFMDTVAPIHEVKYKRPRLPKNVIDRPEIIARLRQALAYPLTLIRAGAGYGKSTIINQALADGYCPAVWFHMGEHDRDPIQFLFHLVSAVGRSFAGFGAKTLPKLAWDERQGYPNPYGVVEIFVDELREAVGGQLAIVLDDFQYVGDDPVLLALVEALTDLLPDNVHMIIASREKIRLPSKAIRRAKGQIAEIGEADLAFKDKEVKRLFLQSYNLSIDDTMAGRLVERTEGWVMAIHMLGENLQRGQAFEAAITALPQSLGELFAFLLQECLRKQPADVRRFLYRTSFLQYLKDDDCDVILGIGNSAEILFYLEDKSFFTQNIDGLFRYHHLFQEYLQKASGLSRAELSDLHRRAAEYYKAGGLAAIAVFHLLAGGFYRDAGLVIKDIFPQELANGRQAELAGWLSALPAEVINAIPELLLCRGDLFRLQGDFADALAHYAQAEREFALHDDRVGKYLVAKAFALVYLDTVQPVLAEEYLSTALALIGQDNTQERARLLQLLAENQINLGCSEKAAALFHQANELFLEDSRGDVEARMNLRTGRLAAAKAILLRQQQEKKPSRLPKSHRETPLLLALINAFMGDIEDALANASEGLMIARRLNAIFVEAVAYMRLGHAHQLRSWSDTNAAKECYQRALEITSSLGVERGKAEPLFGLCLLHGYQGNLDSAERYGLEGLRVAQASKDDWMAAMTQLALAIAYYRNAAADKALAMVLTAESSFTRCGDSYLSAAAMFWHARMLLERADTAGFRAKVDELLLQTQSHGYDFLFCHPTLLGVRDVQAATPVLMAAQRENIRPAYAGSLLTELGVDAETGHHPGYTLRVQTLGDFRIWRGLQETKPRDWQREKAKRLFQYLLTNRHKLLHKEQIVEALWGEAGSDNDFKVAMNAMVNVLEPGRNARTSSFYISKQSGTYGLNLASRISLDADEFEGYINRGDHIHDRDPDQAIKLYRLALNLYVGDYIPECCYEDWCIEERERLLLLYIKTAEKLALALLARGELEECISLCLRIVAKDRCWETAYQTLMHCYHRQNNLAEVTKVYKRCRDNLRDELGVQPSAKTSELYRQIMG